MLIPHPLLGPRDAAEFVYLGDAGLLERPVVDDLAGNPAILGDTATLDAFHEYLHLRTNPAGVHRELWFHEQGDRSWLVVTRDTVTHEVTGCELATDVVRGDVVRDGATATGPAPA